MQIQLLNRLQICLYIFQTNSSDIERVYYFAMIMKMGVYCLVNANKFSKYIIILNLLVKKLLHLNWCCCCFFQKLTMEKREKYQVEGYLHDVSNVTEGANRRKYFTAVLQETGRNSVIFDVQRQHIFVKAQKDR